MLSAAEGSRHVPALHGTATRSQRDTVGHRQGQHFPRDGEEWLWKVVWAETQNVGSSEWSGGPSSDGLGCRRPWQRCDISTLPWSEALQAPELTRGRGPQSCHQPGEGGACRSCGEPPQQSGRTFPEAKAAQGVTPTPPPPGDPASCFCGHIQKSRRPDSDRHLSVIVHSHVISSRHRVHHPRVHR